MILRLALATALVAACTPPDEVGGPCAIYPGSTEAPCTQQLYFPTGLAMDPDGDILYVSNGNSDLRYSGGTVMAIDVRRAECAGSYARAGFPKDQSGAVIVPKGCALSDLTVPAQCLLSPSQLDTPMNPDQTPTIHASSSDHDGCRFDAFDPNIIECDECPFIDDSVQIGNFAGLVRVQSRVGASWDFPIIAGASCPAGSTASNLGSGFCTAPNPDSFTRRLWLPVRGDPSVTYVDVATSLAPLTTSDGVVQVNSAHLSCGADHPVTDPTTLTSCARDSDCTSAAFHCTAGKCVDITSVAFACTAQRITNRDLHAPIPATTTDVNGNTLTTVIPVPLPPEPFGIAIDEGTLDDKKTPYSRVMVTYLETGDIVLINGRAWKPGTNASTIPDATIGVTTWPEPVVLDSRSNIFISDASAHHGAAAIAPRSVGRADSYWYASSVNDPSVALLRIGDNNVIQQTFGFTVSSGVFGLGEVIRDVVFQPDGQRAFFIEDHPPAMFTVDTRVDPNGAGLLADQPRNQVIDIVPVCQGAEHITLRQWQEAGPDGAPQTVSRVYVSCFGTGQLMVIDPDLAIVTDTIAVGQGANDIAFNFGGDVTDNRSRPRRAYVSNYVQTSISVIDLERGSPTEDHVIERIGLSPLPLPSSP